MEFLKSFCAGDVNSLAPLLAEDLQFKGPFYQFNSRDAYLESLKKDPPGKCDFRVLSVTESKDNVSIYYEYEKMDGPITIAQLFRFKKRKIHEILLVFDGRGFTHHDIQFV